MMRCCGPCRRTHTGRQGGKQAGKQAGRRVVSTTPQNTSCVREERPMSVHTHHSSTPCVCYANGMMGTGRSVGRSIDRCVTHLHRYMSFFNTGPRVGTALALRTTTHLANYFQIACAAQTLGDNHPFQWREGLAVHDVTRLQLRGTIPAQSSP